MVNNNQIPIEVNKKPFETVYELKNEIPSLEEFMKNYESDEQVNESYSDEIKSYGDGYRNAESFWPLLYLQLL